MNEQIQQKTIDLARGLFLVRYNGADDKVSPPVVRVYADRASLNNCNIITGPDVVNGTLFAPETALVVSVARPSRLIVEVTAGRVGGSTAANIKIEPLTQGQAAEQQPASQPFDMFEPEAGPGELSDLKLLAHVAGLGDVTVGSNVWIAGPSAPARIEGISLEWPNKPRDLQLQYAVKFARPQRGDNQFVPLGTFAGTRGRALAITGFSLEASGPGADRFSIAAETIFLGAPTLRVTGNRIVVSGPSGREPLVGLKLNLEERRVQAAPLAPQQPRRVEPATPMPHQDGPRLEGRVRVFRSRQGAVKTAG
ncbi:hypothetical protein J2R76_002769 [Bradyrhizobium sp. USDA 4532]|uniref:hypothetical protein n=1 Tax=Bradyrhizobium TaxID=374 RepID=UPI001E628F50|nr:MULTISPECIES: hypothetical protein [Bradyrhizobium]MCP1834432.1 hypothetical protein [Bradyrhizobium sp. USDA 4545]MCP1908266.1 hypothetical protein [Bradyrhizobium elkanii]MCP1919178.1 hypothetical protein [Bradyrhizobium sp. USDA 4532]